MGEDPTAKVMNGSAAALMMALGAVGVRTAEPPACSASRTAWLVAETGSAMRQPSSTSF